MTLVNLTGYLFPILPLLILLGYFGPWFGHGAAGLVVTGLDLGEFVKFIPQVRSGDVYVWRPGFYAPLVVAGLFFALYAFGPRRSLPWAIRYLMVAGAFVAAFNLVPPAWTPPRLLEAEFRWQTSALVLLCTAGAFSPFLGLLPRWATAGSLTIVAVPALFYPLQGAWSLMPIVSALYGQDISLAWGPYCMASGLVGAVLLAWLAPSASNQYSDR
jgi:hypothetical protein